ncbi:DUF4209 domain-containing protein [Massilia haematophila]|uniref:DUF4209 domain-containing protein n=1 Tax=Massilia haematophila TaxID=457923 RepID=A0ABV7PQK0_9BURK
MPDTSAPYIPTLDDLQRCGADDLLTNPTPAAAYHEMWSRLFAGAQAAAAEDTPKGAALDFLAKICSMMLVPDEPATPFKAMLVTPNGSSMVPEHLTAADISLLADLAPTVEHALLRARLADLIWLKDRRRGVAFAHIAIEAYRQPPIYSEKRGDDVLRCRQRAVQLALSIGKGGGALAAQVADELLGAFWKAVEVNDRAAALRYLRPLYTQRLCRDHAGPIAGALEALARLQLEADDPFGSLQLAEAAQEWFERARDDEHRAAALILVAESWVAQGDMDGVGITLHQCYTKAIDAYRRVPARYREQFGVAGATQVLRSKLPKAGMEILAGMQTFSHSIDISDVVNEAVGKVQGLPFDQALFSFCRIARWPTLESLQADAAMYMDGILGMSSAINVDEDGRVIAYVEGVGDEDSRKRRLAAEMIKACASRVDYAARALIDPTLDVIRQQFHLYPYDFVIIAQLSALVPGDRVDLVAKGLYAGYCRDFVQAIHILVPQFEHMVRMVLKEAGAQTTSRQDGIEMELGLSSLVDLPEMKEQFGEDLTFTIRSLMCKPLGPNLRNQVAHGLADSKLCASGYGVYAWWLILALVMEGFHMTQRAESVNHPDTAGEA